jgi:hypothetical protein
MKLSKLRHRVPRFMAVNPKGKEYRPTRHPALLVPEPVGRLYTRRRCWGIIHTCLITGGGYLQSYVLCSARWIE